MAESEVKKRECPYCHQEMIIKSSWKALWRKPTLSEWIELFILVMIVFVAWAYNRDMKVCQDYISKMEESCILRTDISQKDIIKGAGSKLEIISDNQGSDINITPS